MLENVEIWILILVLSYFIIIIFNSFIIGKGLVGRIIFYLIGGALGVFVGFSDYPIYVGNYKIYFEIKLLVAAFLVTVGVYYNKKIWAKVLIVTGIFLWCYTWFDALVLS